MFVPVLPMIQDKKISNAVSLSVYKLLYVTLRLLFCTLSISSLCLAVRLLYQIFLKYFLPTVCSSILYLS